MAYMVLDPQNDKGHVIGNGQCAQFVKKRAGMPGTPEWREGVKIKGATDIRPGTVIATFVHGQYPNNESGQHAAVYESQDTKGIWVWDQWKGQPVHRRQIRFKGTDLNGSLSDNGDAFSVVE